MTTPFVLTKQDKASALWPRLLGFMVQQRDQLRCKNDGQLSEMETATVRGQIKQLNALINMDADRPDITVAEQY